MKKSYLILIITLMLTGCFGEVGSGITSKICTRETVIDDITLVEQKTLKQKDNKIISILIVNKIIGKENATYKSLKNSYLSESRNLSNLGVITTIKDDVEGEYSVSYELDFTSMPTELIEKYEIEDLYHEQLNKYKEEGYKCE